MNFKVTTTVVCADCRMPGKRYIEYGTAEDFGNRMMSDIEDAAIDHFKDLGWTHVREVDDWYCPKDSEYRRKKAEAATITPSERMRILRQTGPFRVRTPRRMADLRRLQEQDAMLGYDEVPVMAISLDEIG